MSGKVKLAIFDFDDTLKECKNTPLTLLFGLTKLFQAHDLAKEFATKVENNTISWPERWDIFNEYSKSTKNEVLDILENRDELIPDMEKVLKKLSQDHDIIMISHNNRAVIDPFLKKHKIFNYFKDIFAQPSWISESGKILHDPMPEEWSGYCGEEFSKCCKKSVLKVFLQNHPEYKEIIYFGDGANDLCPALSLGPDDKVCPRKGFPLDALLKTEAANAKVLPWTSGADVLKFI